MWREETRKMTVCSVLTHPRYPWTLKKHTKKWHPHGLRNTKLNSFDICFNHRIASIDVFLAKCAFYRHWNEWDWSIPYIRSDFMKGRFVAWRHHTHWSINVSRQNLWIGIYYWMQMQSIEIWRTTKLLRRYCYFTIRQSFFHNLTYTFLLVGQVASKW